MTLAFRDDSYLRSLDATVTVVDERGIRLDNTIFYPTGGGQPGDVGVLRRPGGDITIVDTIKGRRPTRSSTFRRQAARFRRPARG
jgi:misacylated tRNA(Ala) deacylase